MTIEKLLKSFDDCTEKLKRELEDTVSDFPDKRDCDSYKITWLKEELRRIITWNIRENVSRDDCNSSQVLTEEFALSYVENQVDADTVEMIENTTVRQTV